MSELTIKFNKMDPPQLSVVGTHDDRRDLHIVFCEKEMDINNILIMIN